MPAVKSVSVPLRCISMEFVLQNVKLVGLPLCVFILVRQMLTSSLSLFGSRRFEKSASTIVDHREKGRFVAISLSLLEISHVSSACGSLLENP